MNRNLYTLVLAVFALSFFTFGWLSHSAYMPGTKIKKLSTFDKIKRDKVLNVVLLNAPSTYYIGTEGKQGFEYDLLQSYARYLGVDLNITAAHTTKEAIELSKNPAIHITSAALAKTTNRKHKTCFPARRALLRLAVRAKVSHPRQTPRRQAQAQNQSRQ